jgi:hypothetical protein
LPKDFIQRGAGNLRKDCRQSLTRRTSRTQETSEGQHKEEAASINTIITLLYTHHTSQEE